MKIIMILIVCFVSDFCMNAIGMESGEIPDQSINATSSHAIRTGPSNARYRNIQIVL